MAGRTIGCSAGPVLQHRELFSLLRALVAGIDLRPTAYARIHVVRIVGPLFAWIACRAGESLAG